MQDRISTLKKIDAAIDAMDEREIDAGIEALCTFEPHPIQAENPKLFAARINKLNGEKTAMIKPIKSMRLVIVAAIMLMMCVTVYAASALNLFSFQQGDRFVIFRTTEPMTEREAKALAGEDNGTSVPPDAVILADTEDFTFESVAEAQQALDMTIPLPLAMPDMELDSISATAYGFGGDMQKRIVWLNYSDEQGRLFGITVARSVIKPGSSVTSYMTNDIDDGSLGKYKSKSGAEYITLTESDDTKEKTAHIATAMIGEYEYSLVFFGFDEAERHMIIDSTDLSVYK